MGCINIWRILVKRTNLLVSVLVNIQRISHLFLIQYDDILTIPKHSTEILISAWTNSINPFLIKISVIHIPQFYYDCIHIESTTENEHSELWRHTISYDVRLITYVGSLQTKHYCTLKMDMTLHIFVLSLEGVVFAKIVRRCACRTSKIRLSLYHFFTQLPTHQCTIFERKAPNFAQIGCFLP